MNKEPHSEGSTLPVMDQPETNPLIRWFRFGLWISPTLWLLVSMMCFGLASHYFNLHGNDFGRAIAGMTAFIGFILATVASGYGEMRLSYHHEMTVLSSSDRRTPINYVVFFCLMQICVIPSLLFFGAIFFMIGLMIIS